jgi:hypothetical protein
MSKKLEMRINCKIIKGQKKNEFEPNLSKDRAMHEGDNPFFLGEFKKIAFFLTVQTIFVY